MTKAKYKVIINALPKDYKIVPQEDVIAFNQRLNSEMKQVNRDFQKKQRSSAERASKIVLNA